MNKTEIARVLGVSRQMVYKILGNPAHLNFLVAKRLEEDCSRNIYEFVYKLLKEEEVKC